MGYMFDSRTGRQTWVPDEEVEDSWKSGRYVFPAGSSVHVSFNGEHGVVDESELQGAFAQGAVYDTAAQRVTRHEKSYYEGKNLATLGLGLARGMGGSLADAALIKSGAFEEDELEKYHVNNPNFSIAGQFAGALLPALASGGTGALAKAAMFTPAGFGARTAAIGAARLSNSLKGSLAAKGIGSAAGMAGKAAEQTAVGRAFALSAEGFIDGGIFGGYNLIGEAILGRADATAETILSEVGLPAVFGGALGGVLGGAIAGVSKYKNKAVQQIAEIQQGGGLPEGNKIGSLAEGVADGDPESLRILGRLKLAIAGEGDKADDLLFEQAIGVSPGAVRDAATAPTTSFLDDLFSVFKQKPTAEIKEEAWAKLLEWPEGTTVTKSLKGMPGLRFEQQPQIRQHPHEVFGQAVDLIAALRTQVATAAKAGAARIRDHGANCGNFRKEERQV